MALTDTQCKNTPAPEKGVKKIFDGGGLCLQIDKKGGRYWRLMYRRPADKKPDVLALGVYPEMTLKEARVEREKAKVLLAEGVDPKAQAKKAIQEQQADAVNTFEVVAKAWHEGRAADGERWTEGHAKRVLRSLELHMFPHIGHRTVADVMPLDVLTALRLLEKDGKGDTAHRVLDVTRQVFAFAVRMRYCPFNPASELSAELKTHKAQNYPTITDPEGIGQLLVDIDRFTGSPQVRTLLKLSPLVFTRPGEVRLMRWDELDLEAGVWLKEGQNMKNRIAHIIPLSTQAVALIKDLRPFTGHYEYVFWNQHKRQPLSDGASRKALIGMGYKGKFTPHGWRHAASTNLHEQGYKSAWVEAQLAHKDKNQIRATYNHAQYLDERKKMMQDWADYLDGLKAKCLG